MISFKVIRSESDPDSLKIQFRGTDDKTLAETRLIVVLLPFHIARALAKAILEALAGVGENHYE